MGTMARTLGRVAARDQSAILASVSACAAAAACFAGVGVGDGEAIT